MKAEEKYAGEITGVPVEAKPVVLALCQYQNGETVDQVCALCGGNIEVEGKVLGGEARPCAWVIKCKCGKCNSTFRGL